MNFWNPWGALFCVFRGDKPCLKGVITKNECKKGSCTWCYENFWLNEKYRGLLVIFTEIGSLRKNKLSFFQYCLFSIVFDMPTTKTIYDKIKATLKGFFRFISNPAKAVTGTRRRLWFRPNLLTQSALDYCEASVLLRTCSQDNSTSNTSRQ